MAMDAVIKVEGVGKRYYVGHQQVANATIKESLAAGLQGLGRRLLHPFLASSSEPFPGMAGTEEFWALRDVSFTVKQGERIGIIGRNGAGKSTLLKILSRITEPTKGRVRIKGRTASLLEVGTGFHPDLTGRENIFLNGAIMGMGRVEIRRKFDEIVAFAEVEKFLDTPVKRYSSGMYVRLAFAVAAHLEPEILIVDEVLAVGDAQFQRKCLGKMEEVSAREGRTVLFVSHNMTAIRNLCEQAIWLHDGQVHESGKAVTVTDLYLQQNFHAGSEEEIQAYLNNLSEDPVLRIDKIAVRQRGAFATTVLNGEPLEVAVGYTVKERTRGLRIFFDLCDEDRTILIRSFHDDDADAMPVVEPGHYSSRAVIPCDLLAPRAYELRIYGTIYNVRSFPPGGIGIPIFVERSNGINRAYPNEPIRSKLLPRITWQTEKLAAAPRERSEQY
jgi:homopolymeric O-antigen transport system ATP-binding protein